MSQRCICKLCDYQTYHTGHFKNNHMKTKKHMNNIKGLSYDTLVDSIKIGSCMPKDTAFFSYYYEGTTNKFTTFCIYPRRSF